MQLEFKFNQVTSASTLLDSFNVWIASMHRFMCSLDLTGFVKEVEVWYTFLFWEPESTDEENAPHIEDHETHHRKTCVNQTPLVNVLLNRLGF